MANLKLSGINKVYLSGATALYNINLEARDKEFLVIVGGEDSGKSTLLRVIAGLEEVSSGTVEIGGKDVTEVDPKDRDIAMIFSGNSLYPTFNIFENMAYGLRIRKAPQALVEQRVKAAANILGLTDVLYRKPKTLTSAARQRAAIGRAIVREPRLYLFEDPLSGLDEKLRADMLDVIINLQARMEGTFVYCTKNLAEAMMIGTRIAVLKDGLLQQVDTPANLYDYPENAYVAFFIGSPTINFVKNAKIVKKDGCYAAESSIGSLPLPENIVARFKDVDSYAGTQREIILGIRPEDAEACKEGQINAKVGKIQSDGDAVYCECGLSDGSSMVVRGNDKLIGGEEKAIKADLTRLYIFDAETRLTLLERDAGYTKTDSPDADFKPLPFPEEQEIVEKLKPKKEKSNKKLR